MPGKSRMWMPILMQWRNLTPFLGWTSGSPPCFSVSRKPYRMRRVTFADLPLLLFFKVLKNDLHPCFFALSLSLPFSSIVNCLIVSPCIHRYHFFPAVFSQIQYSTPKMMILLGMNTTLLSAGFTQYVNCILLWIRYWPRNSSAVHNWAAIPKTHTSTIV